MRHGPRLGALAVLVAAVSLLPSLAAAQLQREPVPDLGLVGGVDLGLRGTEGDVSVRVRRGQVEVDGAQTVAEASLAVGVHYADSGETEKAMEVFVAAVQRQPENKRLLYDAAVVAVRLGRFDRALEYARQAATRDPQDAGVLLVLGLAQAELGDLEESRARLVESVRLDPDSAAAQLALGRVQYRLGELDEAVRSLTRARELQSGRVDAELDLGVALAAVGRRQEALQLFEATVGMAGMAGLSPTRLAQAMVNLGSLRQQLGDGEGAIAPYQEALRLDPKRGAVSLALGHLLERAGRLDEAARAYGAATEDPATSGEALLRLGSLEARGGDPEAAVRRLEAALPELDPAMRPSALRLLGDLYFDLGDFAAAEERYRSSLAVAPDDLTVRLALARLLRSGARLDEARALLDEGRGSGPPPAALLIELALLEGAAGNVAAEERIYRELLAGDLEAVERGVVGARLAMLALRRGAAGEARDLLAAVVAESDQRRAFDSAARASLQTAYALLLAQDGNLARARRELAGLLSSQPDFGPAAWAASVLAALDGEVESAGPMAAALPLLEEARLQPVARGDYGQILWLNGGGEDARPHLLAAARGEAWRSLHLALGSLALSGGRYREATEQLAVAAAGCRQGTAASRAVAALPAGPLWIELGPSEAEPLCRLVEDRLATARLWQARTLARQGTDRLAAGQEELARGDLEAALANGLPARERPAALNNLGVALARLGRSGEALARFAEAESEPSVGSAALLNRAIVLDAEERDDEARPLYGRYLEAGGERQAEVARWVEALGETGSSRHSGSATLLVHLPGAPIEAAGRLAAAVNVLGERLSAGVPNLDLEVEIFRRWEDALKAAAASSSELLFLSDASVLADLAESHGVTPGYRFVRNGRETYGRLLVARSGTDSVRSLEDALGGTLTVVDTAGAATVPFLLRSVFRSRPGVESWLEQATRVPDDYTATANVLYGNTDTALVADYNPLLSSKLGSELEVVLESPALSLPVLSLRRAAFDAEQLAALDRVLLGLADDPKGRTFLEALGVGGLRPVPSGVGPYDREALVGKPPPPPKTFDVVPIALPDERPTAPAPAAASELTFLLGVELPELDLTALLAAGE